MATAPTRNTSPRKLLDRRLTAVVVIALCAFAIVRGWSIVRFANARTAVESGPKDTALLRWVGVPGLSSSALETVLASNAKASSIESAKKRAELLTRLLEVRPFASSDWLSLAGMRLVITQPYPQVLAAFSMSSLTGPNEGWIMWPRGVFGLLQWQGLQPDARQRTIDDLAGAIEDSTVGSTEMTLAKIILGSKPQQTRAEIAALLKVGGLSAAELSGIGLSPPAGPGSSPAQ